MSGSVSAEKDDDKDIVTGMKRTTPSSSSPTLAIGTSRSSSSMAPLDLSFQGDRSSILTLSSSTPPRKVRRRTASSSSSRSVASTLTTSSSRPPFWRRAFSPASRRSRSTSSNRSSRRPRRRRSSCFHLEEETHLEDGPARLGIHRSPFSPPDPDNPALWKAVHADTHERDNSHDHPPQADGPRRMNNYQENKNNNNNQEAASQSELGSKFQKVMQQMEKKRKSSSVSPFRRNRNNKQPLQQQPRERGVRDSTSELRTQPHLDSHHPSPAQQQEEVHTGTNTPTISDDGAADGEEVAPFPPTLGIQPASYYLPLSPASPSLMTSYHPLALTAMSPLQAQTRGAAMPLPEPSQEDMPRMEENEIVFEESDPEDMLRSPQSVFDNVWETSDSLSSSVHKPPTLQTRDDYHTRTISRTDMSRDLMSGSDSDYKQQRRDDANYDDNNNDDEEAKSATPPRTNYSSRKSQRPMPAEADDASFCSPDPSFLSSKMVRFAGVDSPRSSPSLVAVMVLLLHPQNKVFELIQLTYDPTVTTIGKLIDMIPQHATEPMLATQIYTGLARPKRRSPEWTDWDLLASEVGTPASPGRRSPYRFRSGPKTAGLVPDEVLVAIPQDYMAKPVIRLAKQIMANPQIQKLLVQSSLSSLAPVQTPRSQNEPRPGTTSHVSSKMASKREGSVDRQVDSPLEAPKQAQTFLLGRGRPEVAQLSSTPVRQPRVEPTSEGSALDHRLLRTTPRPTPRRTQNGNLDSGSRSAMSSVMAASSLGRGSNSAIAPAGGESKSPRSSRDYGLPGESPHRPPSRLEEEEDDDDDDVHSLADSFTSWSQSVDHSLSSRSFLDWQYSTRVHGHQTVMGGTQDTLNTSSLLRRDRKKQGFGDPTFRAICCAVALMAVRYYTDPAGYASKRSQAGSLSDGANSPGGYFARQAFQYPDDMPMGFWGLMQLAFTLMACIKVQRYVHRHLLKAPPVSSERTFHQDELVLSDSALTLASTSSTSSLGISSPRSMPLLQRRSNSYDGSLS